MRTEAEEDHWSVKRWHWSVPLKKAVLESFEGVYVAKDWLVADKCDSCGKVFRMFRTQEEMNDPRAWWAHSDGNGSLSFVKGQTTRPNDYVIAKVCSAECAGKIMAGGWRKVHKASDATVIARWFSCEITSWVLDEKELVARWDAAPERKRPDKHPVDGVHWYADDKSSDDLDWALSRRPEEWARLMHALMRGWWFGRLEVSKGGLMRLTAKKPGCEIPVIHEVDVKAAGHGYSLGALLDAVGVPNPFVGPKERV